MKEPLKANHPPLDSLNRLTEIFVVDLIDFDFKELEFEDDMDEVLHKFKTCKSKGRKGLKEQDNRGENLLHGLCRMERELEDLSVVYYNLNKQYVDIYQNEDLRKKSIVINIGANIKRAEIFYETINARYKAFQQRVHDAYYERHVEVSYMSQEEIEKEE